MLGEEEFQRKVLARLDSLEAEISRVEKIVGTELKENLEGRLRESRFRLVQRTERAMREQLGQIQALLQLSEKLQSTQVPLPVTGGWALDARSILTLTRHIQSSPNGTVVEAGSGASTVWLGYACAQVGKRMVTLEHDENYYDKACRAIAEHDLHDTVEVRYAPLSVPDLPGHEAGWYDTAAVEDLENVSQLLVDGPPATVGEFARFPALPLLLHSFADKTVIFLDDYQRPEEAQTLKRWVKEFNGWTELSSNCESLGMIGRDDVTDDGNTGGLKS